MTARETRSERAFEMTRTEAVPRRLCRDLRSCCILLVFAVVCLVPYSAVRAGCNPDAVSEILVDLVAYDALRANDDDRVPDSIENTVGVLITENDDGEPDPLEAKLVVKDLGPAGGGYTRQLVFSDASKFLVNGASVTSPYPITGAGEVTLSEITRDPDATWNLGDSETVTLQVLDSNNTPITGIPGADDCNDTVKFVIIRVDSVSADKQYEKVGDTGSKWNVVGVKGSAGDAVTLTLTITPDTTATRNAVSWTGATVDPNNKLKATVPIHQSVRKDVTVNVAGNPCREIQVWPTWGTTGNFRGDNANGQDLSQGNDVPLPAGIKLGINATILVPASVGTRNVMELKGTMTPGGVSAIPGVQFDFKRTKQLKTFWKNTGDAAWGIQDSDPAGTPDDTGNQDEDLHDGNDIIWVVDLPGGPAGTATRDLLQQEYDMREWVDLILNKPSNATTAMSGQKCSNVFSWYSILNAKKDAATGKWVRNNARRNEIRQGTLTIGNTPNE